jgi:phosphoglycerol transferase MdoB-like AlkP superfamily enzyme
MFKELFFVSLVAVWGGTPRTSFAENKVYVNVWRTYPPNRGVVFQTQPLTSLFSSKARGVHG